eukprot:CAMPEP_0113871252 /NCGR_PEP_ID=MMETSP0780_2-20120614/2541_1 /TAXON_ID=652834 /ORGANISM="Palpitomonas bilix" /LENGTH=43 /DNA_ID=CAMNT_0000856625 /DNA_START=583 /DNA_END=714 /DNA_ORIENTATION=+ /assembly_acc=CAM_ASM_000599
MTQARGETKVAKQELVVAKRAPLSLRAEKKDVVYFHITVNNAE